MIAFAGYLQLIISNIFLPPLLNWSYSDAAPRGSVVYNVTDIVGRQPVTLRNSHNIVCSIADCIHLGHWINGSTFLS
jgi:hypothetical protein